MTYLLTVSGYTQNPKTFHESVISQIKYLKLQINVSKTDLIPWENGGLFSVPLDLVKNRQIEPILEVVIEKLSEAITYAIENSTTVSIISYSTGGLLVETALKYLILNNSPYIRHLMLAPAIAGGLIISLANFVQPFILSAFSKKIQASDISVFIKLLIGTFGANRLKKSFTKQDLLSSLSQGIDTSEFSNLSNISRFIVFSEADKIVNLHKNVPNALYFGTSNLSHSQIGSFETKEMERTFRMVEYNLTTTKFNILNTFVLGRSYLNDSL